MAGLSPRRGPAHTPHWPRPRHKQPPGTRRWARVLLADLLADLPGNLHDDLREQILGQSLAQIPDLDLKLRVKVSEG